MIVTRLHAQQYSSSTLSRTSIKRIHSTSHHRAYHSCHKTNNRSSENVPNIDSDINEDQDENPEATKVENISYIDQFLKY